MRVVFMGTPWFAVPALEYLVRNGHDVVAVYTQPDKAAGRGKALSVSPVKKAAGELGLPLVQPAGFKKTETVARLASFKPEAIIVVAFGKILPASVLAIPPRGCLNVHPSLLPKFRGPSPIASALLYGSDFTGVSILLLDEGVDSGPVLARAQVTILPHDTAGSLTEKLSLVGAQLLIDVLPRWAHGDIIPQPQDSSQATYTQPFKKADGEINWALTAVGIWWRVRALSPWPGSYTTWDGKQLKILEAVPFPAEKNAEIGHVVPLYTGEAAFGVGTGSGVLGVVKVQLEGRRAMSSAEFLRGHKDFIGAVLPN
ncbi:MAG: methionyl-tRNA formyltransferase [Chloroflexi bacterium]|nr:methionyl-tRNA formyltransferase [Chloroflexota bacterium]